MNQCDIIKQIQGLIPKEKVLFDHNSLQNFGVDSTKLFTIAPSAIVFPQSIEQVQQLVLWANAKQISLVPSGGRTGLSGGAVAQNGEVVVSLNDLNSIKDVNLIDRTVVCQAGVLTQQLQDAAQACDLLYPVDFASAGSSHIGGNIATNAGGIKVIKYGMTRDWVLGLKVVTGKGELLTLNHGLLKNNTGYDFRHLFIGSEGTLGLIVEATMRLTQRPKNLTVLVLGVSDIKYISNIFSLFQKNIDLHAFEFFCQQGCKIVTEHGVKKPFEQDTPYYILLEFDAADSYEGAESLDQVMMCFEQCLKQSWVLDGVLSQNLQQYKNLWALRENLSSTCSQHYFTYKNDLSVTVSKVSGFLTAVEDLIKQYYPNLLVVWWGHIGDGNLHLNILKPLTMNKAEFMQQCHDINHKVFALVANYQGSISAEHGVGLVKADYLYYSRSSEEIAAMKAIKNVFDPCGILNPNKLLA